MKENYEDKSNNDILLDIKQLQLDHEALKGELLKGYDRLIEIEENFKDANKIITERLNGNK